MGEHVDIQNLSPDHQLRGFSHTPVARNYLLSAMLHIGIVVLTSLTLFIGLVTGNTEEALEKMGEETEQPAEGDTDEPATSEKPPARQPAEKPPADGGSAEPGAEGADGKPEREKSEYEKNLEDAADPDELPTSPGDSGLDLDDIGL